MRGNMNEIPSKRTILIIASGLDLILSAIVLLIYFGLFPVDISGLGIPRWVIGLVGGAWFAGSLAVLVYQLTKTTGIISLDKTFISDNIHKSNLNYPNRKRYVWQSLIDQPSASLHCESERAGLPHPSRLGQHWRATH